MKELESPLSAVCTRAVNRGHYDFLPLDRSVTVHRS
jgi:hypothetical protein